MTFYCICINKVLQNIKKSKTAPKPHAFGKIIKIALDFPKMVFHCICINNSFQSIGKFFKRTPKRLNLEKIIKLNANFP